MNNKEKKSENCLRGHKNLTMTQYHLFNKTNREKKWSLPKVTGQNHIARFLFFIHEIY